ncbi:MAG: hypothetical protein IKR57_03080 [Bacilli bacterium]|nr:hypothetical protein [Bacilli bacterium]
MSKKEEFKRFVSNHTELVDYVKNNKVSWQSLYELYDLYGDKEDIWKKYTQNSINDSLSIKGLLNTLKTINLDSLEENISSIQKAVNLVEELTKPNNEEKIKPKESKIDKLYGEDNET